MPYVPVPTTCGIDGSCAIERLLASDLVAAAAVAVEGLTPPSETRHWPEPRHQVWVETEVHEAETGTILRAVMIDGARIGTTCTTRDRFSRWFAHNTSHLL